MISKGADVNASYDDGCTPFHFIVRAPYFNIKVLHFILRRGGDIYATEIDGETPFSNTADPVLRGEMLFIVRRPLLLFFESIARADGLKCSELLEKLVCNKDLTRNTVLFL